MQSTVCAVISMLHLDPEELAHSLPVAVAMSNKVHGFCLLPEVRETVSGRFVLFQVEQSLRNFQVLEIYYYKILS